jgi:DNA-binding Xre family transcriptional regulator
MGFSYKPLFRLLLEKDMKKTDLHREVGLSSATLAKLAKGEPLSGESIEKLCIYFHCQISDLVEFIFPEPPPEDIKTRRRSRR